MSRLETKFLSLSIWPNLSASFFPPLHFENPNLILVSIWYPADLIIWKQGEFIYLFSDINNNCANNPVCFKLLYL